MNKTNNAKLVIIRGLPGSGKSSLAKQIRSDYPGYFIHYENDQGLYNDSCRYEWSQGRYKVAVKKCFDNTVIALSCNVNVIVANCFLTNKSIERYAKLVPIDNLFIIEATNNFESIHGVSEKLKNDMRNRFEKLSPQLQSRKIEYDGSFHFEGIY